MPWHPLQRPFIPTGIPTGYMTYFILYYFFYDTNIKKKGMKGMKGMEKDCQRKKKGGGVSSHPQIFGVE
jgi:hypothetical protein